MLLALCSCDDYSSYNNFSDSYSSLYCAEEIEIEYFDVNSESGFSKTVVELESYIDSDNSDLKGYDFKRFVFGKNPYYQYYSYHDSILPTQLIDGWEFNGYTLSFDQQPWRSPEGDYKLEFSLDNLLFTTDSNRLLKRWYEINNKVTNTEERPLNSLNKHIYAAPIFSKVLSSIELNDNKDTHILSCTEYIAIENSNRIHALVTNINEQLKQLYGDDIGFKGIFDEREGGECLINEKFEVLANSSKILNNTLFVHRKSFYLNLLDNSGNLLSTTSLTEGEAMPQLSIDIPHNYSLVGWKIQDTNEIIADGNKYKVGYKTLNLEKYSSSIQNGTITLVPIIRPKDVKFYYEGQKIDCVFGEYLGFVPSLENDHMVFCGWKYDDEKLFDGFVTENMEIVPIWNGKRYKFNFILDDGKCEVDLSSIYYKYGEQILSLPNAITKEGYEFTGWFSSPDEDAIQYSNAVGVIIGLYNNFSEDNYCIQDDAVTLYAHYRKINN